MAETKADAEAAFDAFIESYQIKYEKAAECLNKDRDVLLTFYDFPAEHWKHLRTTNPIESTFATVRHRTVRSKGCLSNRTALAMVFKLVEAAQNSWRRLDGHNQLPKLILGVKFADGLEVAVKPDRRQPQPPPPDQSGRHQKSAIAPGMCPSTTSTGSAAGRIAARALADSAGTRLGMEVPKRFQNM